MMIKHIEKLGHDQFFNNYINSVKFSFKPSKTFKKPRTVKMNLKEKFDDELKKNQKAKSKSPRTILVYNDENAVAAKHGRMGYKKEQLLKIFGRYSGARSPLKISKKKTTGRRVEATSSLMNSINESVFTKVNNNVSSRSIRKFEISCKASSTERIGVRKCRKNPRKEMRAILDLVTRTSAEIRWQHSNGRNLGVHNQLAKKSVEVVSNRSKRRDKKFKTKCSLTNSTVYNKGYWQSKRARSKENIIGLGNRNRMYMKSSERNKTERTSLESYASVIRKLSKSSYRKNSESNKFMNHMKRSVLNSSKISTKRGSRNNGNMMGKIERPSPRLNFKGKLTRFKKKKACHDMNFDAGRSLDRFNISESFHVENAKTAYNEEMEGEEEIRDIGQKIDLISRRVKTLRIGFFKSEDTSSKLGVAEKSSLSPSCKRVHYIRLKTNKNKGRKRKKGNCKKDVFRKTKRNLKKISTNLHSKISSYIDEFKNRKNFEKRIQAILNRSNG